MKIEVQHCQKKCWLIVNTLTRSTSRSRRCLLQQESCAGVHLVRSKRTTAHSPGPPAQKRKNHTDDRREQLRRGSEDRPCTHWVACSSIDRRRRRFLLIHSSLSGIIQSTTELFWNLRLLFVRVEPVHRAWKPKESPLAWRRKPQETSDIGPGVELRRKHHQECPIHLGKLRNYSISKTATAELGRARLACWSINTCACSEPRPNLSCQRCCKLRLKLLLVDQLTDNWQRRLESWSSSSSLQRGWSARKATRLSSHHPACSIRYQSLHVSSSANDSFKKFTGARSRRPHHSHFSHGRQHRRSSFCRCRTVREEVRIWWQSRGL